VFAAVWELGSRHLAAGLVTVVIAASLLRSALRRFRADGHI
jgi:hypothetical protein